jgi:cytochrome c biogenesis protein CcmG, thiol:disulfide interchange protein DsbE
MSETPDGRRSRVRLLLQVLALAVVASLLALLVRQTIVRGAGRELVSAVKKGKAPQAPGFELEIIWPQARTWPPELRRALGDGRLALAELHDYPVVINFWASWCVPCKAEAPRLVASANEHSGRVVFLGVDVQDFESDARRFLARYGMNYVAVHDDADSIYSAYGLTGLPETYYLDARGRIVAHSVGEISREELEANIVKATQES